ncbi:Adhesion G-protein coupled receptor D2 [Merluccius polli]|uniref:Adhesion G-protein coupled receptor D2 n=1 Tax=Merluccius polli TaxID=89951 RepID=A0AA47M3K7_MERPO|nr:Adhesion G-protein coupled receptor D2 [Merluccius polli]
MDIVELWPGNGDRLRHEGQTFCCCCVQCVSEPTYAGPDDGRDTRAEEAVHGVHLTADWAYQLVNTSLPYPRAQSFCRAHFSSLAGLGQPKDQEGALELQTLPGSPSQLWVQEEHTGPPPRPLPLAKQYLKFNTLNFPRASHEGFVRVNATFSPLAAVSVCARVQWDPTWDEVSTIFSYAAPVFINEFQLRGQVDRQGRVVLALIIHGQHRPYKASFPNDGRWRHVCVAWRRSDGRWAIYVDGELGDTGAGADTPRDIHGEGILILGQDQDSFGGNFTEPFVGNVTDLNVWSVSLEGWQLRALNACSPLAPQDQVFRWGVDDVTVHPVVGKMEAMLFCPATQGQQQGAGPAGCRTLEGWTQQQHPVVGQEDCSRPLPFICRSSRERYLKMREIRTGEEPFNAMDLGDASALLAVARQALDKTGREDLEPTDMLSLVQLLAAAADVPVTALSEGNRSRATDARELSQHFISVADEIISQDNTLKWQAIKEVVSGPMDVVKSIDRMAASLSPQLMEAKQHLLIQSPNIKLEVRQQALEKGSQGPTFCGPLAEREGHLDCISVPQQRVQDLHDNGFRSLTLVNTWYGALRPLFNAEENVSMAPTSEVTQNTSIQPIKLLPQYSDRWTPTNQATVSYCALLKSGEDFNMHSEYNEVSIQYLGTILGSSVISSTVLGDNQPVSVSVRFRLQHKAKHPSGKVYNPVCAFWDFDLIPEAGGWWNTRGCEVVAKQHGSTVCSCNHTTNFALLLQVYEVQRSPENERALQVLTFIGCGVSLCGLLFTFILFIAVGVPKSDRTTVHKNLIVALGIAQLLLMCSDWASAHQELCYVVTALLHLFFMASFSWMLVEGLLLWSKVVSVNISEDRRMKLYYIIGWGLPVLIVGVTLVISLDKYKAATHCWLNVETDMIWAFVGPVLFVLGVNVVVLCRVVMVTVSSARRRSKMLTPSSVSKMLTFDLTWAVTRPVLILLPVLGLTWLCGVLVHLSVVIAYVFIALNAFQGLYIFLVYAVYNSEVRNAIKRIKEKRKALSFTNCSQPTGFLPSQRAPAVSWGHSLPAPSSPETSETSGPPSSASASLVIKNGKPAWT